MSAELGQDPYSIMELMDEKIVRVLDHGFVKLRNLAGPTRRPENHIGVTNGAGESGIMTAPRDFDASDVDVANAARMSFDQMDSGRTYEDEMRLNRYLMKNHHDTPFESIVVWLEFKLPIFVARQFVRHRTQSLNEVSARYVQLPSEWYIPEVVMAAPTDKKQGTAGPCSPLIQKAFKCDLDDQCRESYRLYSNYIKDGVAPEQARSFLHVNHYTHWLSTMNLRNLFHFLGLRDHSHAQFEAQQYARAVTMLLEPHIPGLMKLYYAAKRGEL